MKETYYKLKHRVTALFAAAVMLCSMLPGAAFAEEPTPQPTEETVQMEQQTEPSETDNGQADESSPDPGAATEESAAPTADEPAEENKPYTFDGEILYADMPDAPTGSYLGSYSLPVATGETKIGLGAWDADLEQTNYLSAEALDSDNLTLAAPLLEDTDYSVVPILAQVEYPADGSTLDLVLPDGVTLLDYYGAPAENAESLLHNKYSETSAAVLGVYVRADADFTAELVYTAPDGSSLTKTLNVTIDRNAAAEYPFPDSEIAAFAERPTPAVTSGKITKVAKINGTWLIWFNGEEAYCCTHGANGQPTGCPPYTYVNTSTVSADQCVPGDHYGNQIRIWGGLNQLSLGDADDLPAVFSADDGEEISLLDFCASIYDDVQMYIIENFPESTAAEIYLASADELLNGVETYASARGYYTYIYNPGRAGWQTVALIGPEIGEEEPEPEPVVQEYYASWEAPAQTASGSFDFSYGIRTDKIQLKTQEKVDGATIEIEPITKSGSIDGGSWSISPASKQTVTTSGHTADDNYQNNGGDASASWSLHYAVTKTSGTRNGQVGPFTTQEAADAAANSARDSAIAELQGEAQNAVNNAIAAAKAQLGSIQFRYEEITVPYGFGKYWGSNGSQQTISVPANTNNDYVMKNDEWSLQVNLKKADSETGSQIAADADGNPLWHTTIRDNSGQWVNDYLPILKKDHLVASAKIEDGWLCFSNLYLGKYYVVERSTGVVIPLRDGALAVSGTYPTVDSRTKAATGQVAALASSGGQYTDWVYKNQFSTISKSKALDGSWTYDAYSLSFANGYLCDEHNYYITPAYSDEGWYVEKTSFSDNRQAAGEQIDKTSYRANYHLHADNALAESQDQVAKGNVEISKIVSSSGQSNGLELENAGFTFYLVSDLSKASQFDQTRTGAYTLQSILDAYINKSYDNAHLKWDFSDEMQAIAKTYEVNAAEIAAYNKTLTAAGENKNGKGDGWQPTGNANEYQLAEIFSSDTGNIRVQGLPYGTYLVVETTTPKDLYQAEPFLVSVDPAQDNNPWCAMATPKGSVMTGSDSYQKFTVLDEEIEVYLRITKIDEETGKPVLLPGTAFQIYWLDDMGHYRYDNQGNPKLVTMTDTVNGHLTKNVTTFYTNAEGILTLPEKLPLGKYRIVEITGPNGFYNEWKDTAGYENGILADDADGSFYVDFTITTDRIYQATGDKNENGMDTLVIGEKYANHETLGKLTIRKTGEVLTGWQSEPGGIDLWMTGEAENGNFTYETRPLVGAEYTITAAEDIYTQDRQLDNYGNRTLWYAKGDVVAVVTTGDGTADTAVFAPARTAATYDFLSVIHDGTIGEVSVTLPLGSYHIAETKPPYGYVGTDAAFDVTLAWDNQTQEIVAADAVEFHNERERAKVGIYKTDLESGKYLAGAVFNLYTTNDIYDADGSLVFAAGELVATSPETNADGYTYFTCDIPIRGEQYGSSTHKDAATNSGKYIAKELRAPLGYYVNEEPMEITFTYDGQTVMVLDNTCSNKPTEIWVSKRDLTNDEELPGATLTIQDMDGNIVESWVSTDTPHRVTRLHLGDAYTLTETRPADGYALADDITFRLLQKVDEDGSNLQEAEVYYLTTKNFLIWTWDDWKLLDDATVIMRDDTIKVEISKKDLTTMEELPGAELTITDKDGKEIDRWVSTDRPHYIEKLPAGDYTLTEVKAPDGYAFTESVPFTVLPTGEVQKFEMLDDVIKVEISKKDLTTMEELPGAELTITDKDGKKIDRWVSTDKPHYIEKLPAGDYTLTEVKAPDGYALAESVPFTVLPTGEVQQFEMRDDVIKVEISKVDITTNKELPGAELTITDKDGKVVEHWTSTDKPHYIEKLPAGTYTLTEITAPNGYEIAEDISFTVLPTGEVQRVVMKDAPIPEQPVQPTPPSTPTPTPLIPQTGDTFPLGLLLALAGLSLAGLAALIYKCIHCTDVAQKDDDETE